MLVKKAPPFHVPAGAKGGAFLAMHGTRKKSPPQAEKNGGLRCFWVQKSYTNNVFECLGGETILNFFACGADTRHRV